MSSPHEALAMAKHQLYKAKLECVGLESRVAELEKELESSQGTSEDKCFTDVTLPFRAALKCQDCGLTHGPAYPEEPSVGYRVNGKVLCNDCDVKSSLPKKPLEERRNPKDIQGATRVPMHLVPAVANVWEAAVHKFSLDHNPDREPYNWRQIPISLSGYISAIERHIQAIKDGEWTDPDTGELEIAHFAEIRANTGIILDAHACGTLINDLPKQKGGAGDLLRRLKSVYENKV